VIIKLYYNYASLRIAPSYPRLYKKISLDKPNSGQTKGGFELGYKDLNLEMLESETEN
jgi:hypothetical protein